MFTQAELQSEQDVENFKAKLDKITDDNIHAAFQVFTVSEIISKLLEDKIWFKLSDRAFSLESLQEELSNDNEIMLDLIRFETTVSLEIEKIAVDKVEEVIADFEVTYAS